jgi:RsiW-degrading membrane proteinase PrsW (M82 family)
MHLRSESVCILLLLYTCLTAILSCLVATQNEKAVRNLMLGTFIPTLLHFILRLLLRRRSLPPSKGSVAIYVITYLPTFFLVRYLEKIGTTRRDAAGTLISSGEDLSQPGITEWCFDIIYVTCKAFS